MGLFLRVCDLSCATCGSVWGGCDPSCVIWRSSCGSWDLSCEASDPSCGKSDASCVGFGFPGMELRYHMILEMAPDKIKNHLPGGEEGD
ncbi:MAG: hypothetical protein ACFHWX_02105 [Bacteroidota bacterium]